ncbi:hypothetical protein TNCV_1306371 [Trichonephila clavipes]|nr:hypothetical protein TNCV_1306371 [Trichonephila clavipes]
MAVKHRPMLLRWNRFPTCVFLAYHFTFEVIDNCSRGDSHAPRVTRWNVKKANWGKYASLTNTLLGNCLIDFKNDRALDKIITTLQAHLFKIGLAVSPLCALCISVPMTGEHLSDCPALLQVLSQDNLGVFPARATSALYWTARCLMSEKTLADVILLRPGPEMSLNRHCNEDRDNILTFSDYLFILISCQATNCLLPCQSLFLIKYSQECKIMPSVKNFSLYHKEDPNEMFFSTMDKLNLLKTLVLIVLTRRIKYMSISKIERKYQCLYSIWASQLRG